MIYSQNRKVGASLCGPDVKLSAVGVLILVEESLTELTGELHIDGVTAINKYGAVLAFNRNHIKIFRSADWNERIVVESFVSSKSAVRFAVDTCIKNENGEMIAYSRVELCGIDTKNKQIRKTETYGMDEKIEVHAPLFDISFNKKQKQELDFLEEIRVRSSNIDYAHHTNNVEYIRYLMNTFSVEELESHFVSEMEINYANQSFEGDALRIYGKREDALAVFEIKKGEESVLKCEMKFCLFNEFSNDSLWRGRTRR